MEKGERHHSTRQLGRSTQLCRWMNDVAQYMALSCFPLLQSCVHLYLSIHLHHYSLYLFATCWLSKMLSVSPFQRAPFHMSLPTSACSFSLFPLSLLLPNPSNSQLASQTALVWEAHISPSLLHQRGFLSTQPQHNNQHLVPNTIDSPPLKSQIHF